MTRLLLLGLVGAVVIGCGPESACIRSHRETRMVAASMVGNVMVPIYREVEVCDEYAKPTPGGRDDE